MQQEFHARNAIVELIPKACATCGKVVHALFRSQEEFDTFKCQDCSKDSMVQLAQ